MIVEFNGTIPHIEPGAFVAESAVVIGDVVVESGASIWFQSVVRGDTNYIRIGANCNIQDACVLHVVKDRHPLVLERDVVLGHRVVVHGCTVRKGSLIAIGAIVLDGAEIGEESIVGAGSVVTPGTIVPPRSLVMGTPARVVRPLNDEDVARIRHMNKEYLELKEMYRQG